MMNTISITITNAQRIAGVQIQGKFDAATNQLLEARALPLDSPFPEEDAVCYWDSLGADGLIANVVMRKGLDADGGLTLRFDEGGLSLD